MPDNLPQYSYCAQPGVARSHKTMGGLLGFLISPYFKHGWMAVTAAVIAFLAPLLLIPCFEIWTGVITINAF